MENATKKSNEVKALEAMIKDNPSIITLMTVFDLQIVKTKEDECTKHT